MGEIISVAYSEVKVGDRIYDPSFFTIDKWREVTNVSISEKTDFVTIKVGVTSHEKYDTRASFVGHKKEGIGIKKPVQS